MEKGISVVVRSKNEEATIGRCLELISHQSIKPLQIILVDNDSKDRTIKIAKSYGCEIVNIPAGQFNHAMSCNLGAEKSRGDLIVFTNGHSFPSSFEWLENGKSHFKDQDVAGVYSIPLENSNASGPERFLNDCYRKFARIDRKRVIKGFSLLAGVGLMATTSAMIRRDLWMEHPFEEKIARLGGGEDSEWGFYQLKKGLKIIQDPDFVVYHSHGDSLFSYLSRQIKYRMNYLAAYLNVYQVPR